MKLNDIKVGDIVKVELNTNIPKTKLLPKKNKIKLKNMLKKRKPDAFIVVGVYTDICRLSLCWLEFTEYTSAISVCDKKLFFSANNFYDVNMAYIKKTSILSISSVPQHTVNYIIDKSNQLQRSKQEKRKKRQLEVYSYSKQIDIASMNNDHEKERELLRQCKGDPWIGSSSSKKMPQSCSNPKPYSGGSFTPK